SSPAPPSSRIYTLSLHDALPIFPDGTSQGGGARGNGPGLLPQSFAEGGPGRGFSPPDSPRAGGRLADHHPQPGGGRRRSPGASGGRGGGSGRRDALLRRGLGDGPAVPGDELPDRPRRARHLQERSPAEGNRGPNPLGPVVDRDGCPLSGAASSSRQAKRERL